MARRRRTEDGLLDDLYRIFLRFPLIGPAVGAVVVFGGMRWALPAILRLFAMSMPASARSAADVGQVVSHSALTGIADAVSWWAPWATIVLVGLPTAGAWMTVAWRRTPMGRPDRLRSSKRVRSALVRGDGLTAVEVGGLSWPDFEKLVADGFRLDGYSVDHVGRSGPDGGIDLRLRRGATLTLVQCKHWKARRVGVAAVRELTDLITQHKADGGILITSGSFSHDAQRCAAATPVQLMDGVALSRLITRGPTVSTAVAPAVGESVPACPLCGAPTVPRTSRFGAFHGCSRYPMCRGVIDDRRLAV